MSSLTFRGQAAELRWSYHRAARLGPWTLVANPSGVTVTAPIEEQDAFRVSQRPITFVGLRPTGAPRRWPVTELQIADGRMTASLGPQED